MQFGGIQNEPNHNYNEGHSCLVIVTGYSSPIERQQHNTSVLLESRQSADTVQYSKTTQPTIWLFQTLCLVARFRLVAGVRDYFPDIRCNLIHFKRGQYIHRLTLLAVTQTASSVKSTDQRTEANGERDQE